MEYRFGDCQLDVGRRELMRAAKPIPIGPQVFDLLVYLVKNRARVVSKDDLLKGVWGGRIVSKSTLTIGTSMRCARRSATAAKNNA